MNYWFYPLTAVTALLSAAVTANEESDDKAIEVIVVSAGQQQQNWLNTPASVSVKTLPQAGLLIDSGQLLQGIPGLQVDSRANFAQDTRLSLRGFGSRSAFGIRGLYLQQDGIPISAPDGQGQLSSVLLDSIGQIEVLSGPLAVLYGNGAGGVISLTTREQIPTEVSSSLAISEVQQQYQLRLNRQTADHSWQVAAKHFETEGFRPHAAARKQQLQAGWQQLLTDDLTLKFKVDWANDPRLQDPLSLSVAQWREDPTQTASQAKLFDTTKTTEQRQLSATLQHSGPAPWQVALWQGKREVSQRLAFTGEAISSAGGDIALARAYHGINAQKKWQLTPALSHLLGGAWVKSDDLRRGYVNQFGQRGALRRDEVNLAENRDLYWRFSYQHSAALSIDGGLRYSELRYQILDNFIQPGNPDDSGSKNYYQHAAAIGLTYRFAEQWSWFVSTGKGFEAPTLAELAYKPEGTGLNLALQASQNQQWESGFKYQGWASSASLSLFSIRSNDELLVASSNNGRTSYRNAGNTARDGIEFNLKQQLTAQLKHELSLTLIDARFQSPELKDKRLPGVAKTDAYWQLRFQPNLRLPVYLEWRTLYRGNIATTDNNTEFAPAALTFDATLHAQQQLSRWQLNYWLKLDNLTDRDNVGAVVVNQTNGRAIEPAPGRQLSAGLSMNYLW
ncbi:TonB-dependent receptor [Alishewanella longhuensis]|uniref:TonB-dependent receptor n=1 Tax=Alishewanella longhuensis TaxID=1091037 RepID=A0ABQ3KYP5_9ALTE|nr:TonB-dependent receptor [Alishewanella longhuensis]GHG70940.1 TonB-dependent receptor [Alishewanella longhuensis]